LNANDGANLAICKLEEKMTMANPFEFMATKNPNGEPSAAAGAVEISPLGPQDVRPAPPAQSKPTYDELAKELEETRKLVGERRGGPVHREARSDPRPRHQLRPVSEMADQQESTPLHIPASDFPDQFDLTWVTDSVLGQPQGSHRMRREQRGWVPVHGEDFGGKYDGRFTPKGTQGEINVDGMVLMARPKSWSEKARKEDQRAAQQAVAIKAQQLGRGALPGVSGADHVSAKNFNHLRKHHEPLQVPNEGIMD
jgi:hypothetical protein